MRYSLRRIKLFLPIMLIAGILFSGCTIGNTQFVFGEVTNRELVFDMGGYGDCDKQRALVYLLIAFLGSMALLALMSLLLFAFQ